MPRTSRIGLPAFLPFARRGPIVPVVRLSGVIGRIGAVRSGLTLAGLAPALERAFRLRGATAVALAINSPGGSPVQSSLIHGRIRALAEEKRLPVLAFIEDVGASGGYWIACAADEIYADANSIVGSIGVITAGFGLNEAIQRLGIERRVYTSGERKGMLDPFQPENARDVKHLRALQVELHENFKELVRTSRRDRLAGDEKELFSGAFWSGQQAQTLGLVDGMGELQATLRARYGDKTRFRPFGERRSFLRRRFGMTGGLGGGPDGGAWAAGAIAAVEERLLWSRFGL